MFITPLPQLLRLLAYTFLLGIALGALYDLFRIFKVALLGSGGQSKRWENGFGRKMPAGKAAFSAMRREASAPPERMHRRIHRQNRAHRQSQSQSQSAKFPSDTVRRLLQAFPAFLLHFVTDLLFFFIAAVVTVIFFYAFHRGKIRVSAIFSLGAGFALYYFTVGRLVFALAERIVRAIRRAISFTFAHTVLPPCRALKAGAAALYGASRRKMLQRRALALSEKEKKSFLALAGRGFGAEMTNIAQDVAQKEPEQKRRSRR